MGKRSVGTKKKKLKKQSVTKHMKALDRKRRQRTNASVQRSTMNKKAKRAEKYADTSTAAILDPVVKARIETKVAVDMKSAARGYSTSITKRAPEARNFVSFCKEVEKTLNRRKAEFRAANRCADCWHAPEQCCCEKIRALVPEVEETDVAPMLMKGCQLRVIIYMHYLEWGNAANTGKLLRYFAPVSAIVRVYGCSADEEAMVAEIAQDPARTMLLYPGEIDGRAPAMSCAQFLEGHGLRSTRGSGGSGASAGTSTAPAGKAEADDAARGAIRRRARLDGGLTVIVLDATYGKARTMAKHFAKVILLFTVTSLCESC